MLAPPLVYLVGDAGDLHAEDERQARGLNRLLVGHADTWDSGCAHDSGNHLKRRLDRRCAQGRQKHRGESAAP
jgi:hypothetical protein